MICPDGVSKMKTAFMKPTVFLKELICIDTFGDQVIGQSIYMVDFNC